MPCEDLKRLAIPRHHHEMRVRIDDPLRFVERAAALEMNRLRQLNDPLPRKVSEHLQTQRVMMRPEVAEITASAESESCRRRLIVPNRDLE